MDAAAAAPPSSINAVQTAAELRRQLHMQKARDREAVAEATQTSATSRFLRSNWATALFTGLATFLLLYVANPLFVQEPVVAGRISGAPNLRRVLSWSVLVTLLVALGPYVYQKFLAK